MKNSAKHKRISLLNLLIVLAITAVTQAHPLGNSSITHFSVLWILPDRIEADLLFDFAELPSSIIRQEDIDLDQDNVDTEAERKAWRDKQALLYESQLKATINGHPIQLKSVDQAYEPNTGEKMAASKMVLMMPGFANMPTYKLLIRYVAKYPKSLAPDKVHTIVYTDTTYPEYTGLRRIILERANGIKVIPPHPEFYNPEVDPFLYELYDPANLPQERSATIKFSVLDPTSSAPAPAKAQTKPTVTQPIIAAKKQLPATQPVIVAETQPTTTQPSTAQAKPETPQYVDSFLDPRNDPSLTNQYFSQADEIIGRLKGPWSLAMILIVTALAFGYGEIHALMPGHAKTVVAAYLISQHGTYRHAILLAIVVTITHTALVVMMGLIIWAYQASNPTLGPKMQLWLGMIAGILVAAMGFTLIWRALTGRLAHHHDHDHEHHHHDNRSWFKKLFTHSHPHLPDNAQEHTHTHDHDHGHHHHHHESKSSTLTTRMILFLGITGGIVPCPTATIIMLLGIGANVVLGALYAIGIFSLGLALTLMIIGFAALSSRRFASKLLSDEQQQDELSGPGKRILLIIVPAISGTAVIVLGSMIAAHYIYMLQTGNILFNWIG